VLAFFRFAWRNGLRGVFAFKNLGYPRKTGHPLEGSCQEVKRPPYPPLGIFFGRGTLHGISLPICRFARARVFSGFGIDRTMATHQTPIRIKAR
jgi:hypothetical protein